MPIKDKEAHKSYMKEWHRKNKNEQKIYIKNYQKKNRLNLRLYTHEYRKNNPWLTSYASAEQRCNNKNHHIYKNYGGRGIRFHLTKKEIKQIWHRDKADFMEWPSIDRINNDGHYEFSNCRFIEMGENSRKRGK